MSTLPPPAGLEIKTAVLDRPAPGQPVDALSSAGVSSVNPLGIVTALVAVTGVRDHVGDVIPAGAFARTLRERQAHPRLLHHWHRPIGNTLGLRELPPGHPELPKQAPDGRPWPAEAGALVARYRLDLSTKDGRRALAWAQGKLGTPPWYSIGYVPVRTRFINGSRYLDDLDLWEYSMVHRPANDLAFQVDVKSLSNLIDSEHQMPPESIEVKVRYVRDAAYWGYPVGTPITAAMKPKGKTAIRLRRAGRVPARTVGTATEKPAWTDTEMSVSELGDMRMKTEGLNEDHVAQLTEKYRREGYQGPPIQIEKTKRETIVTDGHHRLAAAERAGIENLPVRVFDNTPEGRRAANQAMSDVELAKTQPRGRTPADEGDAEGLFPEPDTGATRVRASEAATGDIEGAVTSLITELENERHGEPDRVITDLLHEGETPAELEEDLRGSENWSVPEDERDDLIESVLADYRAAYAARLKQQAARRAAAAAWTPPSREAFDRIAAAAIQALDNFEEKPLIEPLAALGHDDPEGFAAFLSGEDTTPKAARTALTSFIDERRERTEPSGDVGERIGDLSDRDDQDLLDLRRNVLGELNLDEEDEATITAAEAAIDAEIQRRGIIALRDVKPGDVFEFQDRRYYVAPDGNLIDPEGEIANLPRTGYQGRAATLIERDAPAPVRRIDADQLAASAEHVVADAPAGALSPADYDRERQRADARRARAENITEEHQQADKEAGWAAAADALAETAPAQLDLAALQARRQLIGNQAERRRPIELGGGGRLGIVGTGGKGWKIVTGSGLQLVAAHEFDDAKPPGKRALADLANRLASLSDAAGRPAPFTATYEAQGSSDRPDWIRGWRDAAGRSLPEAAAAVIGEWAQQNGLTFRHPARNYRSEPTVPGGVPDADGFTTRHAEEAAPGDEIRLPDGSIGTVERNGRHGDGSNFDQIILTDGRIAHIPKAIGAPMDVRFADDPDAPQAQRDPGMGNIAATVEAPPGAPITIAADQWDKRWPHDYDRPLEPGTRLVELPASEPATLIPQDHRPRVGVAMARLDNAGGHTFQTVRFDDGTYAQLNVEALRRRGGNPKRSTYVLDPTPEQVNAARAAWDLPPDENAGPGGTAPSPAPRREFVPTPAPEPEPLSPRERQTRARINEGPRAYGQWVRDTATDEELAEEERILLQMRNQMPISGPSNQVAFNRFNTNYVQPVRKERERRAAQQADRVPEPEPEPPAPEPTPEPAAELPVPDPDAVPDTPRPPGTWRLMFTRQDTEAGRAELAERGWRIRDVSEQDRDRWVRRLEGLGWTVYDFAPEPIPVPGSEPRRIEGLEFINVTEGANVYAERWLARRVDKPGIPVEAYLNRDGSWSLKGGVPGERYTSLEEAATAFLDWEYYTETGLAEIGKIGQQQEKLRAKRSRLAKARTTAGPDKYNDVVRKIQETSAEIDRLEASKEQWRHRPVAEVPEPEPEPTPEPPEPEPPTGPTASDLKVGDKFASPETGRLITVDKISTSRTGRVVVDGRDESGNAEMNSFRPADPVAIIATPVPELEPPPSEPPVVEPSPPTVELPAELVDEAAVLSDEVLGLLEQPDGSLEVTPEVGDRQDRVAELLDGRAAGTLDLSQRPTEQLTGDRDDLSAELALQAALERRAPRVPREPRAPGVPRETPPTEPQVRPGLVGAAQDHAEALRSGDTEAITRTQARLESSLRRSRAGSAAARQLADHVTDTDISNDPEQIEALANLIRAETRARRAAGARKRRTVRRLERERIRSLLGEVEAELGARGAARFDANLASIDALSRHRHDTAKRLSSLIKVAPQFSSGIYENSYAKRTKKRLDFWLRHGQYLQALDVAMGLEGSGAIEAVPGLGKMIRDAESLDNTLNVGLPFPPATGGTTAKRAELHRVLLQAMQGVHPTVTSQLGGVSIEPRGRGPKRGDAWYSRWPNGSNRLSVRTEMFSEEMKTSRMKLENTGWFTNTGFEDYLTRSAVHELGHHLDYTARQEGRETEMFAAIAAALGIDSPAPGQRPEDWVKANTSALVERVGAYAGYSDRELIAELWTEYRGRGVDASPAAQVVGDYLSRPATPATPETAIPAPPISPSVVSTRPELVGA